jgi:hypothetical protein
MDILNIDDFVQPKRVLKLDGKEYPVQEVDVQTFIDNLAAAEKLEGGRKVDAVAAHERVDRGDPRLGA